MTITSHEEVGRTPWTIADVALSIISIVVATVLILGTVAVVRFFVSAEASAPLALVGALLAELAMLLSAWYFGIRKHRMRWSALGFRPFDPVLGFALVSGVLLASFTVNIVYVQAISYLGIEWLRPPPILPPFLTGVWRLIIPLLLASGIAPLAEETFFRGFVYAALKRRFGLWLAIAGSALLFTLAHLQASVLIPVFVLGVLLAWLYERTRSLWPCIFLHFTYNTLAVLITYSAEVSRSAT